MSTPPEQSSGTSEVSKADRLLAAIGRLPLITAAAVILVLVGLALLVYSLSSSNQRPLYPALPTFTPVAGTVDYEPIILGFTELNADPAAYAGQRIQVSGTYTPIAPPDCLNFNGPIIHWSLVADELQLNAIGFENVVRLVDDNTEMTVTGIWRAYHGPVGCGKEPTEGTVWYLAVDRILEPNPLFGAAGPILTVISGSPLPTLSPLETVETPSPATTLTLDNATLITPTITIEGTSSISITPTIETTAIPVTPLGTPGTPATTATSDPAGTSDLTPTIGTSPTPTATDGSQGTTTPGLPTSTPSGTGYPSQSTPTPTATTTGGYP